MALTTVSMEIELRDVPGQLLNALKPLSDHGGNIRSIIHHRGKVTPRNTIPVNIVFEIAEGRLASLLSVLKSEGFRVSRLGRERLGVGATVLLIGHIVHTDLKETIHAVDSTGTAEVVDMSLAMPGIQERSSASLRISATGPKELGKALGILERVAQRKGLLLVKPVGT